MVRCIGEGHRRKPPTYRKSHTNFITKCCIEIKINYVCQKLRTVSVSEVHFSEIIIRCSNKNSVRTAWSLLPILLNSFFSLVYKHNLLIFFLAYQTCNGKFIQQINKTRFSKDKLYSDILEIIF